jgi:hypothetical protein
MVRFTTLNGWVDGLLEGVHNAKEVPRIIGNKWGVSLLTYHLELLPRGNSSLDEFEFWGRWVGNVLGQGGFLYFVSDS